MIQLPLEELALLDNQADAVGLAHAAKTVTLRKLDAKIQNDSLPLVAQLPKLEEFKLEGAQITDDGLQSLAAAKSLRRLTLNGKKKSDSRGCRAVACIAA